MLILIIGILEMSRYILIHHKLEATIASLTDLVGRGSPICSQELESAVVELFRPFDFDETLAPNSIILSSIIHRPAEPGPCDGIDDQCVAWKFVIRGNIEDSRISGPGMITELPGDYVLPAGDAIVAGEINYHFYPILDISKNFVNAFVEKEVYRTMLLKPRLGQNAQIVDCGGT